MHKPGSCQVWTLFRPVLYHVHPGTYYGMVWNHYKQSISCLSQLQTQYVLRCTTGLDPSKFGFSEECSGYTMQFVVWRCQYWVYPEHSSEKPNLLVSWPVVQGGTYWDKQENDSL